MLARPQGMVLDRRGLRSQHGEALVVGEQGEPAHDRGPLTG